MYIGPTQEYSSFNAITIWIVDLQPSDISNSQRITDVQVACVMYSKKKSVVTFQKGITRTYLVNK